MGEKPLLYTKDLKKDYITGNVITHAVKKADITINEGEFIAIMGHSGSGKSTLMHMLGFLDSPTSGTYVFDGIDTKKLTEDQLAIIRNKKVGFVFQAFNLLPRTSTLDNVRLPMIYAGVPEKEQIKRAVEALKSVGLEHRLNNLSNELSGGEQQRVAIARALVKDPVVILADEPTGNLDSIKSNEIYQILKNLSEEYETTILVVTHDEEMANKYAKCHIYIRDGKIVNNQEKSYEWRS